MLLLMAILTALDAGPSTLDYRAACSCYDVTAADGAQLSAQPNAYYDMLNPKGRRKAPSGVTMAEDRHLPGTQRRQAIAGMRDLRRNSSVLQWMVAQHLNWVVSAGFQSTTGDEVFDAEAESFMAEQARADRFEFRGMLDFEQVARLLESHAVLDGDCGVMFLDNGRVQGIEGDRIKDPDARTAADWYNGVQVVAGVPVGYAIHRRRDGGSSLEFERTVPVGNMHLHGYYDWRFDQYRGVSPVVSAFNQLRDLYESEALWLVKLKIAGLLGMKVKRGASDSLGATATPTYDENGNVIRKSYQTDFGAGPWMWDLDPGDDIDMVSFDGPGGNTQEFWRFCTAVAMAALDLPYSMWDSTQGNFFGNKTAWLAYSRSCDVKRARCCATRDKITAFKYRQAIRAKQLLLPRRGRGTRMTVDQRPWQWVPRLMPWWRPLEEVTAELKAIGGGLSNPYHACMESDQGDFEENIRLIAKAMAYAKQHDVPLSFVVGDEMAKAAQDATAARKAAEKPT